MSESNRWSIRGIVKKIRLGVVSSNGFAILVYERAGCGDFSWRCPMGDWHYGEVRGFLLFLRKTEFFVIKNGFYNTL